MNRMSRVSMITLAVAVLGVGSASAQHASIPIGKNGDVELTAATTKVGTTALKPGHYRFTHVTQDGQDYLVVSEQRTQKSGSQHYATGAGTEVARVPCQIVPLDAKVKSTELHTRTEPDGSSAVTQIRVRGERVGHLVALEPKG